MLREMAMMMMMMMMMVVDVVITTMACTITMTIGVPVNMISNTEYGNDIIAIAINMTMDTIMYTTIALIINDTTSSNINIMIKQ